MTEMIKIGEKNYRIVSETVSGFRSSVVFENGEVVMKLSRYLYGKRRDSVIDKFRTWAQKKLSKMDGALILPVYCDGGKVVTHNKIYEIYVRRIGGVKASVKLVDNFLIEVRVPEGFSDLKSNVVVKDLVEKFIIKDQTKYLKDVVGELNQLFFQEQYNVCKFKRTSRRFGSCSSMRNINIAYRLLFAPKEVFRYVCVHELAHLKEMNHSKRFWAHVENAMPDYKESEKWLRENGFILG